MGIFSRKQAKSSTMLDVVWNQCLQPVHRHAIEDAVDAALNERRVKAERVGGGTAIVDGKPGPASIEYELKGDPEVARALVIEILELMGAPRGSTASLAGGDAKTFGVTDGLAVVIAETNIPDSELEATGITALIGDLLDSLGDSGRMSSWWNTDTDSIFYLNGPSATEMRARLERVVAASVHASRIRITDVN